MNLSRAIFIAAAGWCGGGGDATAVIIFSYLNSFAIYIKWDAYKSVLMFLCYAFYLPSISVFLHLNSSAHSLTTTLASWILNAAHRNTFQKKPWMSEMWND